MTHTSGEASIIEGAPRDTHFAAVNSGRGFVSFYGEIFGAPSIHKRYIIKGGPGTGKSSFMKRVAAEAEVRGRAVEYYRCSSDPRSLDGIIIDGETALLDGTPPHVFEPILAGVTDEIIDLGRFWDSDKLYVSYNEIAALSALRSECYAKAYKFLSGALNVKEINDSIATAALLYDKMDGAVERIFRNIPEGRGGSVSYAIVNAIGMSGRAHLRSYEQRAKHLYTVFDCYGMGTRFLERVREYAKAKRQPIRMSVDPLDPSRPDALYLEDIGVAFVLADGEGGDPEIGTKINMKRFIDDSIIADKKGEYKINVRIFSALLDGARQSLVTAGEYHFKLEGIYSKCMDFCAQNIYTDEFCKKLFMKR